MEIEEFQSNCNNKVCLKRQRYDNKTCVRSSKQINCHKSYERLEAKKIEKYSKNKDDWESQKDFDNEIWIRDTGEAKGSSSERVDWNKYCRIWAILTPQEKSFVETDPECWLANKLELAHIKPRSTNPDKIKDPENIVLISHLFHTRLTGLKDPIYNTPISNQDAERWLLWAKNRNR